MFRNLTIYQLPSDAIPSPPDLAEAVAARPLRAPGPLELFSAGFVTPYSRGDDRLALQLERNSLIALGTETRILPAAVVNEALAEKLDQLAFTTGRRPVGRARSRLRDEVVTDLMPRAFLRPGRTLAWLDHRRGLFYVDSAAAKPATQVVDHLRDALGSFPATPIAGQTASPRLIMSSWLAKPDEYLPSDITLGDECQLSDPGDDGAIARLRRQDLGAEEVSEHFNAGKQVTHLGICFAGRLQLVLGADLVARKLRYTDVVLDTIGDDPEDQAAARESDFALLTGEVTRLVERLRTLFDLGFALDGGVHTGAKS